MKILIIVNDAPYGTEKAYNAMRLAMALQREHAESEVRIFLIADAVACALPNQSTPQGYYNLERMFKAVMAKGGQVKACGTCSDARGIGGLSLIDGVEISTMSQLTTWVVDQTKSSPSRAIMPAGLIGSEIPSKWIRNEGKGPRSRLTQHNLPSVGDLMEEENAVTRFEVILL